MQIVTDLETSIADEASPAGAGEVAQVVADAIKRRVDTVWADLEPKPIAAHSRALNRLAGLEDAPQVFASLCAETAITQREASTWRSLEPVYAWPGWRQNLAPTVSPLVELICEGATTRGVRNRKAIVREIEVACVDALNGGGKVDILSVGGGAAPALREMMERVRVGGHVLVLDRDEVPGADLNWLKELPCDWEYELRCADARELIRVLKGGWRPLIVEMVGVSDYMRDEKLLGLLRRIRRMMATHGWLITANVDTGLPEKEFLRHMVCWPELIYRDREELLGLLADAGFGPEHAVVIPEPCGVFNIVAVPQNASCSRSGRSSQLPQTGPLFDPTKAP